MNKQYKSPFKGLSHLVFASYSEMLRAEKELPSLLKSRKRLKTPPHTEKFDETKWYPEKGRENPFHTVRNS